MCNHRQRIQIEEGILTTKCDQRFWAMEGVRQQHPEGHLGDNWEHVNVDFALEKGTQAQLPALGTESGSCKRLTLFLGEASSRAWIKGHRVCDLLSNSRTEVNQSHDFFFKGEKKTKPNKQKFLQAKGNYRCQDPGAGGAWLA